MHTIDYFEFPHNLHFKLEDYSCKRHRQPLGAVCGSDLCDTRLLCNDCIKEHDFGHLHDLFLGYTFSESYVTDKANQFLRERIPILNHHERAKEKMKSTFKAAFDQFRADILNQLDEFEYVITDMIEESTNYVENYERMRDHLENMVRILTDSKSKGVNNMEDNSVRLYIGEYKSMLGAMEDMKSNFNYEQLQLNITTQSNEFLKDLKQRFTEFRTSWTASFGTTKPHDLGSFLKAKPKFLQGFNDRVTAITYSEHDRVLAVLEGSYKIHFFSDVFDLNRQFFRLGFSKLEDYLSSIKWTENGSLLLCNNSHKWVKLHYPSKTYSCETSTSPEGPIKKLSYFPELKLIIVVTEYWVICYQAGQTFMPIYYKMYSNGRVSDICLIRHENMSLIAVSTGSGYINVHDVINRTERYQFKAHNFGVGALNYWGEKKILISTGQQGDVKVWKMSGDRFRCMQRIHYQYGLCLTQLVLVPSHGWIIAVHDMKSFVVYSVFKNKKIGVKKVDGVIVEPCYVKEAGKIVFGMDKGLYQLKI